MSESSKPDAHEKAWENAERTFAHKNASEFYDPCQDFADRSLKCLKRNGYDREMCGDYFQYASSSYRSETMDPISAGQTAYRDCKKNWLNQKKAATGQKQK